MGVSSTTVDVSSFTTDAKFRTWGSAVSAALAAAGLTQTADTGQINWATVTKPVAITTKAGYEIWRFNDSLQSTRPIFFRIDYGSSSTSSGNSPNTWLTVGTGSDGAGNITGVGMAVTSASGASATVTNTASLVGAAYSASAGACTILAGLALITSTAHGHAGLWVIARTADSSGAPTGDGVAVTAMRTTGGPEALCASYSPAVSYAARNPGCGVLSTSSSISSGSEVQLYRHYAIIPNPKPHLGMVSYFSTDVVSNSTFTAAPFGSTNHTYLALGSAMTNADSALSGNIRGACIWE